jgi:acyl carrier protein|tara:strand:- start:725 stop:934 length:210 start_codon:yes stop_codon:yes gene_type:complete
MSNSINEICKILKVSKKKLIKLKRKTCEEWDSLAHLEVMFIVEKNSKKRISINKLEKLNKGADIINLIK